MKKSMNALILSIILSIFMPKNCVAISDHALMTRDGNVWETLDDLHLGGEYVVLFDTQGDDCVENDIIIRVWGRG